MVLCYARFFPARSNCRKFLFYLGRIFYFNLQTLCMVFAFCGSRAFLILRYILCENGWPAFRIFKKNSGAEQHVRLVVPADSLIKCYDRKWDFGIPVAIDKNVQIALPFDSAMSAISFGIKRKDNLFNLQVALFSEGRLIQQQKFPVEPKGYIGEATSRYSQEIIFTLSDTSGHAPDRHLEITDTAGEPITVIEPLYQLEADNPRTGYAFHFTENEPGLK